MFDIKRKFYRTFISLVGIILLLAPFNFSLPNFTSPNFTKAQTEITQDTTWTVANSPYLIRDSIFIRTNVTLTIEPGVVVKFEASSLIVEGHLKALGTEKNKIIFTSYYDDEYGGNSDGLSWQPKAGDWTSIYFTSGATGQLDNVLVRYGGLMPICLTKGSDNFLKAKTAYASSGCFYEPTGAIILSSAQLTVENSEIKQNHYGIKLEDQASYLTIHNSKIYQNIDYGIYNELSNPGTADATNNWWGNDSGPRHPSNSEGTGDRVTDNVLFNPWIGKSAGLIPVIIIPGIIGSYLNRNNNDKTEVWPNVAKMFVDPWDTYLNELAMESTGYPNLGNPTLLPIDIIRSLDYIISRKDYFEGLISKLENNGYQEGESLFVFPYDWRFFLEWSATEGDPFSLVKSLKEKIEEVKIQTGAEKVNIISHSMGGLVAKYYIKYYGQNSVAKFIDIATPHLGSPKAFKILMYGDDISGVGLTNQKTLQSISQNIPSIYQLLPSRNYFSNTDQDYAFYLADIHDLDNNGIKGGLNYDQSIDFMENTGRNDYLLEFNDTLHNTIDYYSPRLDGIKTYNVIGCGQPTLGKIYVLNKEKSGKYEYGLKYINGDSTVPLRSAESFLADKSYYSSGTEHAYLPSADGIKQLIVAILKGEEDTFNFSTYPNLKIDKGHCSFSGKQISFHSPIELHVYDEAGNHLGPNQDGDIEMEIPGAQYDIIDDNKFVFLPTGHNYQVIGQATESGAFNARIQNITDTIYTQTFYYNEIPLNTASTTLKFEINDNQTDYPIIIDQNGDQIFEEEIQPNSILNKEDSQDLTKPETQIEVKGTLGNDDWYKSLIQIELTAQDNIDGSGILKTEYSLDNSQNWQVYQEPLILDQNGEQQILYQSTDKAGNLEETKTHNFKIDKSGPQIEVLAPQENQEFLHSEILNLDYQITDDYSGVASSTITILVDEQSVENGSLDLFHYKLGEHNLKITSFDLAGNGQAKEVKFIISATIDSTISDIERSYNEGYINKKIVRDQPIKELEWIKGFSPKQEKLQKFVSLFYRLILKQLNYYYQKGWVDSNGYNIIKEDIEWLIKNL